MKIYKQNIILVLNILCLIVLFNSTAMAQCPAVPPSITNLTETGTGEVQITFSVDCSRDLSACEAIDGTSHIWHVALLGQGSPSPNGTNMEYGSSTFYANGCNFVNPRDGGDNGIICVAPKNSTCRDAELGQNFSGITGTFSINDICNAGGSLTYTIGGLCEGQTYDVYLYEMEINTIPNDDPSAGGGINGPYDGIENAVACGDAVVLSEAVSSVGVFTSTGTLAPMSSPTIRVSGLSVCAAGNGDYSSTHQSIPTANSSNNPGGTGAECLPTTDVNTDMSGGPMSPNTIPNDLAFTDGANFGSNVILVNCRDNPMISFPTPTGCKGTNSLTGSPLCDPTITDFTNAAVYMWVEDISSLNPTTGDFDVPDFNANFSETSFLLGPNTFETYPDCHIGSGEGLEACPPNTGTNYPNNYTGRFGNFITQDGCGTNFSGNNPLDGSISPFNLPGTVSITGADGIVRASTIVCIQYEDDCNGTKSRSCVRFVSDITPMVISDVTTVDVSCAGNTDGSVTITGLSGGTPDPNQDGDLSDGTGTYTFAGGLTFTQTAPGTWEATNVAPGTYDVVISDPTAAACGSACDVTFTAVVRPKLPSTITGMATVCPDQCVTVDALLTENPIVNYDLTSNMDLGSPVGSCPGGTGEVTGYFVAPFVNSGSPVAGGGTCSSAIGNGSTDATLVEVCFQFDSPDHSNLFISIDNGANFENLYVGANFGAAGGVETGSGLITFCTSAPVGSTYDGTLDGDDGGASFDGSAPNDFLLFIQEANGTCGGGTLISASVSIIDRCVEPQTAAICTDAGMDALNWTFNNGPGADFITLNGPTNESAEACATGATPAGDYIYDVSGFHVATGSSPAICCPASGQVTVSVLNVPTPPTPSIANGTEYCSGDATETLTFSPALAATPGSVLLANYTPGDFPVDWGAGLYMTDGTFISGRDVRGLTSCDNTYDDGSAANAGIDANVATMTNLAPGTYELTVLEDYGDGLDGLLFTITDHCGNLLMTEADVPLCPGTNPAALTVTFTVDPNQLIVTGTGITQTSNPDGIANNGDEVYEFNPAAANIAAADGSSCGENLINYQITTSCGCMVDETIALFVYGEVTATNPVAATCDPSSTDVTFTVADLMNGADGVAGGGDDLTGGTGSYLMTYNDGSGVVGPIALADITINTSTATSPVVVTITDSDGAYTGSITDPQGDGTTTLDCDGNACSTTINLVFPTCMVCNADNGDWVVPHCSNGVMDADETGIDCGGADCPACLTNDDTGNE